MIFTVSRTFKQCKSLNTWEYKISWKYKVCDKRKHTENDELAHICPASTQKWVCQTTNIGNLRTAIPETAHLQSHVLEELNATLPPTKREGVYRITESAKRLFLGSKNVWHRFGRYCVCWIGLGMGYFLLCHNCEVRKNYVRFKIISIFRKTEISQNWGEVRKF